jgi:hypothetical protein
MLGDQLPQLSLRQKIGIERRHPARHWPHLGSERAVCVVEAQTQNRPVLIGEIGRIENENILVYELHVRSLLARQVQDASERAWVRGLKHAPS